MAEMPAWLTARPVAHRGLHDRAAGRWENTLPAAEAAARCRFAVECDLQLSADGEAMVFHDFELDRLTGATGVVAEQPASALRRLTVGGTSDCIPRLTDLLDVLGGRVPLICEIKSDFQGDMRLADRAATLLADYRGPVAIKSFDPAVIAHLRRAETDHVPLGIVAEATYDDADWKELSPAIKRDLAALTHFAATRPDFLSYAVDDLPQAGVTMMRAGLGRPVMAWTVRTAAQRARADCWADQMVFEGFQPDETPHPPALV